MVREGILTEGSKTGVDASRSIWAVRASVGVPKSTEGLRLSSIEVTSKKIIALSDVIIIIQQKSEKVKVSRKNMKQVLTKHKFGI